jgi:manganese-dependent inorganic pyrophosphatase
MMLTLLKHLRSAITAITLVLAITAFTLLSCGSAVASNQAIWVVGHKNPDTDAIVSAIAVAKLKTAQGIAAQARAQGKPNPETEFVLKRFGFDAPPVETVFAGRDVILVDHSDYQLAPDDLKSARLVGIFDHHKLGGIQTDEPIEVIIKPWGSTATVLFEQFQQANVNIDAPLAGLLLSGILSDTRVFLSPTTTEHDKAAASALAKMSGIADVNAFGRELLQAYNDQMRHIDDATLLNLDLKRFQMGKYNVGVSQIEAFDAGFLTPRIAGLRQAMIETQNKNKLDVIVLAITDIDRGGSTIITLGPEATRAQSALELTDEALGTGAWKSGLFSRKRQLIPALEREFSTQRP